MSVSISTVLGQYQVCTRSVVSGFTEGVTRFTEGVTRFTCVVTEVLTEKYASLQPSQAHMSLFKHPKPFRLPVEQGCHRSLGQWFVSVLDQRRVELL
jgi:hypothetical protein